MKPSYHRILVYGNRRRHEQTSPDPAGAQLSVYQYRNLTLDNLKDCLNAMGNASVDNVFYPIALSHMHLG